MVAWQDWEVSVCVFLAVGLLDKQPAGEVKQQTLSCSFSGKHTDLLSCVSAVQRSVSGLVITTMF